MQLFDAGQVKNSLFSVIDSLLENRDDTLTNPQSDFTRTRKISFTQAVLFPMVAGSDNVATELLDLFGEKKLPMPSAMIQRRSQIRPEAFRKLFYLFTGKFAPGNLYYGYQLVACDGSRINLPYNPSDADTFICAIEGRKGINQVHLNSLYDVLNDIFLDIELQGIHRMNEKAAFCPGVRAGLGFDFRISDGVKIALELQDNGLNNQFNTLDDNEIYGGNILWIKRPFKWDDNFAALLGLKFDLGANAKRRAALAAAEAAAAEAAALAAAKAAAEKAAAEKAAAEKAAAERAAAEKAAAERAAAEKAAAEAARAKARAVVENVYFELNKSILRDSELPKVEHIIAVLNQFPEAVVSLTGYADKKTGTPKRNWTLSQERAERVAKALTDAGIAADRISTSFYGDTIQVSEVPEENRVCVCVTR